MTKLAVYITCMFS